MSSNVIDITNVTMADLVAVADEMQALTQKLVQPRFYIARVTDNGETFTRQGALTFTDATVACECAQIMNRDRDEQDEADGAEYCAVTDTATIERVLTQESRDEQMWLAARYWQAQPFAYLRDIQEAYVLTDAEMDEVDRRIREELGGWETL